MEKKARKLYSIFPVKVIILHIEQKEKRAGGEVRALPHLRRPEVGDSAVAPGAVGRVPGA